MTNGLTISKKEFNQLPRIQKDEVMFDNLVYIRERVKTWRFHLKVQYVLIAMIFIIGGWIFRSLI